jgi:phosphoglycerate dehydrogenase-like enzyme
MKRRGVNREADSDLRVVVLDSIDGDYLRDTSIESEVLAPIARVELLRARRACDVSDQLRRADALIAWHKIDFGRSELEGLSKCKGLVRASVGMENIDLEAAEELGITVENIPDYGTEEVADHTIALILAVSRNLCEVARASRSGDWRWQTVGQVSRLRGQRLGIVGLGRIGTAVALRAKVFGLEVAFCDPYIPVGCEKALGIERVTSLRELAERTDILSLHVPLTPETHRFIGRDELRLMPQGAIVVNTSRGGVVDQDEMIAALEDGHIAGAGLDVLADEPAVPIALRDHRKVVLTAHSAFYSQESLRELRTSAAMAARRLLTDASDERGKMQPEVVGT